MSESTPPAYEPPPHKPVSVALARAMAEAADGFPGHAKFWIIADYTVMSDPQGFHVRGPIIDWSKVSPDLLQKVDSGEVGVFGPYDTSGAPAPRGKRLEVVCLHFHGDEKSYDFKGYNTDALFFSPQAVEKFALPYYERIYGPEFALQVWDEFLGSDFRMMAHFPWSEYTDRPRPPGHEPVRGPAVARSDGAGGIRLVPAARAKAGRTPA